MAVTGWLLLAFFIIASRGEAAAPGGQSRCDAAIAFYVDKLKSDPYDFLTAAALGEVYVAKARLTANASDYRKAEHAYRRSLRIMPKHNIEAQIGLAAALTSQHRFKEAEQIVQAALAESPDNPELWSIVGDVAFDLGDYGRAGGFYKLYANAKPGLASWSRLAKIKMLYGSWEQAGKLLEKCTTRPVGSDHEPSAWAWVMRGVLYFTLGKITEANNCYERALTLLPDYALALEHKAEINLIEKKFDEAIKLYRQAIASSANPELWIFLGDAFEKAGQHDSALHAWRKGESMYRALIKGGNNGYLRHLALFYLNHNMKTAKALTLAQKDLKIRQDYGAYLTLARAYLQLGKKKEALDAVEKASLEARNDPLFCYYAGEIYLANGNVVEARKLFTQALRLCPTFDILYDKDLTDKLLSFDKKESASDYLR
jgi:tetratricopeptide (TPR) repeat protein